MRCLDPLIFFIFFCAGNCPSRELFHFFSLCLLPLRWTACARQTFFFWLCMQKLCYFSPVLSLSCGACSSLFFFACCRSAGQQDSLCAPDFFIFYFFLSLHARAEYFFFSRFLSACHFFCLVSRGVHADFFLGVHAESGHFSSVGRCPVFFWTPLLCSVTSHSRANVSGRHAYFFSCLPQLQCAQPFCSCDQSLSPAQQGKYFFLSLP